MGVAGSTKDCFGTCGKAKKDSCGICQMLDKFDDNKYKDCNGDCKNVKSGGRPAFKNKCGKCVGGKTGKKNTDGEDKCGICGGDDSSCKDCAGTINGDKTKDICGTCLSKTDKNRDKCDELGKPSKTCAIVGGSLDIPVASTKADFKLNMCSFGEKTMEMGKFK